LSTPLRNPLVLGSAALLAALLSGCNDSVTCVFTSGCGSGPGAISDNEAALPVDGDVIVDGRPDVVGFFPTGSQNPGTIPIVLVFSETMLGATLLGAVEVVPILGGGTFGPPVQGLSQALVSDGRVLLLFPLVATGMEGLPAGDYIVRIAETAEVTDLTGQELDRTAGEQLGDFTIALTPPTAPRVVTTFPAAGAVDQSPTTEIVAVFDRPVTPQSVTPFSFDVRVDGADPANDPPATPVVVQVGSTSAPDPRAWVWRSLDGDGLPQSLGADAQVELRLSPAASPITDEEGGIVPPVTVTFRTLPFAPPLGASLLSDPPDAIGLANLTEGDAEELTIEVELDGLQPNDAIDLFLFGPQRSEMPDPPLIALQRTVQLTGTAPIQSVVFTREQIGMQLSDTPADVRFEDGPVTFAFRARRGARVSPLRVLDLDPDPVVIQDPLLDTQAPTVTDLVGTIGTTVFRSDQRGLSLAGQADEPLRAVEVSTPLGGNGTLPPVVGSSPGGLFLAAPVPLGRLDAPGTTTFSFAARDEALNTAPSLAGTFTQLGALGPGAWTPGADITVQVFDAGTLGPLAGAQVIVHADMGDGMNYPFVQTATTLGDGTVTVSTAGAPAVAAIVTVAAGAYDLFTLHGPPSTRLSVPLVTSNRLPASAVGAAQTTDPAAIALLPGLDQRFDDSRRPRASSPAPTDPSRSRRAGSARARSTRATSRRPSRPSAPRSSCRRSRSRSRSRPRALARRSRGTSRSRSCCSTPRRPPRKRPCPCRRSTSASIRAAGSTSPRSPTIRRPRGPRSRPWRPSSRASAAPSPSRRGSRTSAAPASGPCAQPRRARSRPRARSARRGRSRPTPTCAWRPSIWPATPPGCARGSPTSSRERRRRSSGRWPCPRSSRPAPGRRAAARRSP
jgi:hypothetical protein